MATRSSEALKEEALSYLRSGTSVSLRGLPGSGRTAALRAIAQTLASSGWTVVEASGNPALIDRPLEALAIAGLVQPSPSRPRSAVASAVEELRKAVEGRRAVVVIDDVDVLDAASIGAVAAVLSDRAVPLLSSASTARHAPELSLPALVRPGVRLVVPPLSFEDSQEIVQTVVGGRVATESVGIIHARAGGLPGLVGAIAGNASRHGLMTERDGTWTTGTRLWTVQLSRTVEPFLQGLTEGALDGLMKLSLVGTVEVEIARRLVGWPALEQLDDRGLLNFVTAPGSVVVSVYPPLLAEHLRRERVGARRLRVLGEIDEALAGEQQPTQSSRLARALDERGLAVRLSEDDGENRDVADAVLNRLVYEKCNAEQLVRRAEWEQHRDGRSAVAYASSLMIRGNDPSLVEQVLDTEVADDDARSRAQLALLRALLIAYGRKGPAAAFAFLDLESQDARHGSWLRLLHAARAHLELFLDHAPNEEELAAGSAPEDASPAIDPVLSDAEHLGLAEQLVAQGRPRAALAELALMQNVEAGVRDAAAITRGVALVVAGDLDAAEEWSRRFYEDALARFDPAPLATHGYVLALVRLFRGDDAGLREHLGPLLSIGYVPLRYSQFRLGTLVIAARSAARAGRVLTARSLADQAVALGCPVGPYPVMLAGHARASARLVEGAPAVEASDELWRDFEEARSRGYRAAAVVAGLRSIEEHPDAARAASVAAVAAEGEPGTLLESLARYATALAASAPAEQLAVGAELVDIGLPGYGIALQSAAVTALAGTDPDAAESEARRLRRVAERLGGEYPLLLGEASSRGVLTAREREVAELAAAGLSNNDIAARLMVSVRTVENHLHRVFQKLEVDARAGLAAALADRA